MVAMIDGATMARKAGTAARNPGEPGAAAPATGAHFRVLIGNREVGFCQVSRLQLADATAADAPGVTGPVSPSVVFRRALTDDRTLYAWRETVAAGKRDLRTITIHQTGADGETVRNTWVLHGCRPVRWSGPAFDALRGDLLWEELEVVCQRLDWVARKGGKRGDSSR